METQTLEQIQQHYKAMLDSVWLINAVIAGEQMSEESLTEKQACVERNVQHLELMLAKDYWTTEDMQPIQQAIQAGNSYLA